MTNKKERREYIKARPPQHIHHWEKKLSRLFSNGRSTRSPPLNIPFLPLTLGWTAHASGHGDVSLILSNLQALLPLYHLPVAGSDIYSGRFLHH
jgi:hypothetical protein